MASELLASLEVAPLQQIGSPVYAKFTLSNQTGTDYRVLLWSTPLEGVLYGPSILVSYNGQPIPFDGPLVLRGEPGPADYVVVPAGGSVSATVDLSAFYAFNQAGAYEVRLDTHLQDYYPIGDKSPAARQRSDHKTLLLTSPVHTLQLAAGTPRLTIGAQQRVKEAMEAPLRFPAIPHKEMTDYVIRLSYIGGTSDQRQEIFNAWVVDSALMLNASRRPIDAHFITWFGTGEPDHFTYVMDNYRNIYHSMGADQYTINLSGGEHCRDNVIAYTFKGARIIYLCNLYWSQPTSGMDSKWATLVHEITHDVAMTDDYTYGQANCQSLAANDHEKAIKNASNYMYFSMGSPRIIAKLPWLSLLLDT